MKIVKNYHSGTEIKAVFKALDEQCGRSETVVREHIESIQKMESLRSELIIKSSKNFLSKQTANIPTLRYIIWHI